MSALSVRTDEHLYFQEGKGQEGREKIRGENEGPLLPFNRAKHKRSQYLHFCACITSTTASLEARRPQAWCVLQQSELSRRIRDSSDGHQLLCSALRVMVGRIIYLLSLLPPFPPFFALPVRSELN